MAAYHPTMTTRTARCSCGQLTATCSGEPVRISVCHCLNCQRRSGSAFAAQARFPSDRVEIAGEFRTWSLTGDSGGRATFRFCPTCSATIAYQIEGAEETTAVPIGAFADPNFPAPRFSVYENRKHRWLAILGDEVEHD